MKREQRKKAKKKIIIESLLVFAIALVPIYLKFYEYFPNFNDEDAKGPVSFLWFSIGNNGFDSVATNIWYYTNKLVPLLLLIIWFFTSKDWWYHIILIPIATYSFQLFELVFDGDDIIDSENIWWLLPICMVIIPFVYFIRIKLYDKYVHGIDLEAMEAELQELKAKPELQKDTIHTSDDTATIEGEQKKQSLTEKIDRKLSTSNMENLLKNWQHKVEDWLHLKF
jgi:hypothetical protein